MDCWNTEGCNSQCVQLCKNGTLPYTIQYPYTVSGIFNLTQINEYVDILVAVQYPGAWYQFKQGPYGANYTGMSCNAFSTCEALCAGGVSAGHVAVVSSALAVVVFTVVLGYGGVV